MEEYKKFLKVTIYILLIFLIILLFTFPLIIAEIWNGQLGRKSSISVMIDNIVDGVKNGNNYDKYAQEYFKDRFGIVSSKMKMLTGYRVDDNKYAYAVKFDCLFDSNIYIYSSVNGNCSDNFYEVLSRDNKFQHLYSNWVKKQVGIDDEDVELSVKCNNIFFENIKKYDSNDDIFENCSGTLRTIVINNVKKDTINNFYDMFIDFEKKYVKKFYDNNITCAYQFIIKGDNEEPYLDYTIEEYRNQYSNECYRTKKGYTCEDELYQKKISRNQDMHDFKEYINSKISELYSMVDENNNYQNISSIDFNEKTYKYIINDVLINNSAPVYIFNISDEIVNKYMAKHRYGNDAENGYNADLYKMNLILDNELSNKLRYNDGFLVFENIVEEHQSYRFYIYEIELVELHYNVIDNKLCNYYLERKIKSEFFDEFGGKHNEYTIYVLDNNNWEEVFTELIGINGEYVEIDAYAFKNKTRPKYDFYDKIEKKMQEYYETIKE